MDNDFFLELWEVTKSYCPEAKRVDCAYQLLGVLEEYGVDEKSLKQLVGEDHDLDEALKRKGDDLLEEDSSDYDPYYGADDEDEEDY